MEAAAQAQTTLTATDPVQRWLARRSAGAPPSKNSSPPTSSLRANSAEAQRARRAPQKRPGTVPRRTPFCARPLDVRRLERRQLTEAAELFLRHQHKGLPWDPTVFFERSWLRFFKRTSRAPRTTADAQQPHLLRRPPPFPSRPAAHGSRILRRAGLS